MVTRSAGPTSRRSPIGSWTTSPAWWRERAAAPSRHRALATGGVRRRGWKLMIAAYVLIQTQVGKLGDVAHQATRIPGVVSADGVTGPYDVVVRAEADT